MKKNKTLQTEMEEYLSKVIDMLYFTMVKLNIVKMTMTYKSL